MSEVSKIEVDGANYDIKDETARANAKTNADAISQLNTDLTNKLGALSGVQSKSLESGASIDFSYDNVCLIFVVRATQTTNFHAWLCDRWSGVVGLSDNTSSLSVTASDKVATLTNNLNANVSYLVFVV